VAIYASGRNHPIFFFDSLYLTILPKNILSFLDSFPKWLKNSHPYQSPLSNACGHHCLSFIYFLSLGYSFQQYLSLLDRTINPDLFVKAIVNKMAK
jgi:hypothetical protein